MNDQFFMHEALKQARLAYQEDEVPVGAVIVQDNECIAEGWNQPIRTHDPSAHAEMVAIRQAGQRLTNYRLPGTTLYVTLEPCVMCVGALIHARVDRVVFAAWDKRAGGVCSRFSLVGNEAFNHVFSWAGGVLEEQSVALLQAFFQARR